MLDGGAIRPLQSPWCNTILLVQKKDGTLQFCIDFQQLNARMKKDSYLIPRGLETMESLLGIRYFSTMDLKSRFWQVKMSEESSQYMAFTVGSMDMYKFLRMPYGLCNVPATFHCLMQNCLGELNLQFTLIYLDHVIIYSRMQEDHLTCLQAVLDHFAYHGAEAETVKVLLLQGKHHLPRTQNFCQGYATRPKRYPEDRQHGTPHYRHWNKEVCGNCWILPSFHQELLPYHQTIG